MVCFYFSLRTEIHSEGYSRGYHWDFLTTTGHELHGSVLTAVPQEPECSHQPLSPHRERLASPILHAPSVHLTVRSVPASLELRLHLPAKSTADSDSSSDHPRPGGLRPSAHEVARPLESFLRSLAIPSAAAPHDITVICRRVCIIFPWPHLGEPGMHRTKKSWLNEASLRAFSTATCWEEWVQGELPGSKWTFRR